MAYPDRPWYRSKEEPSFADFLSSLRRVSWQEQFPGGDWNQGLKNQRLLTPEVVLWVVLAMGLFTELPIRQVFKHARRLRVGEDSPTALGPGQDFGIRTLLAYRPIIRSRTLCQRPCRSCWIAAMRWDNSM